LNNIETRTVIKFLFFLQGKVPKEIHAILEDTLACFLPGRVKDLPSPMFYIRTAFFWVITERVVVISYRRFGKT